MTASRTGADGSTGVLETTWPVVKQAQHVRINHGRVGEIAGRWIHDLTVPEWNRAHHWSDGGPRTVNWLLVLDALNFCFWPEPKWQVTYQGKLLDGYWALAASLTRAMEEGIPIDDARYLAGISATDLREVFRGEGEIPLLARRVANLREVGEVLLARYDGQLTTAVEAAGGSAVRFVQQVVADFFSFGDGATYRGHEVRFYKRAQILVGDIWGTFGGERWGAFHDLDRLTAFADYKLPQVLRRLGVLEYSRSLAQRVDQQIELAPGSPEEVEIRSATIWAVELLRQAMARLRRPLYAFQIDWCLWDMGQSQPDDRKPYHRTRTIYY